jgi:pimeloyl-ACP methyl ester carboxylesterase
VATTTTDDGVTLYYETEGSGETVVFVDEAGYGAWQWGWQHRTITGPFETLVWDLRGTGRSDSPDGLYDVDRLARDLEAVIAATSARRVHLVGAGLGGMVALRYASEFNQAATLALFGTAPSDEAVDREALRALQPERDEPAQLRESLTGAFTDAFLREQSELVEQICEWRRAEDAAPDDFESQVAATCSFEAGPLYELTLPALVCHGVDDPVVELAAGRELAGDLPRGTFEAVEGRHLCFIEHARAVTDRLFAFLEDHARDERA